MSGVGRAVLLLSSILVWTSCGGGDPHAGHDPIPQEASGHEHGAGVEDAAPSSLELSLDGHRRWAMDEYTRTVLARMSGRLEGLDLPSAQPGVLRGAGEELQADLDDLIQGCAMTGEAHNQIHRYLAAAMPAIDGLADRGDPATASRVAELLELYPAYFD